jgi:hypothetical protein
MKSCSSKGNPTPVPCKVWTKVSYGGLPKTVFCDNSSSVLAHWVDFLEFWTNAALIKTTCSSLVDGQLEILPLLIQPLFRRLLYHCVTDSFAGKSPLPRWCSEPALNCSHRFWLRKPNTTLTLFLLQCYFRLRMAILLEQPVSELHHVTETWSIFLYIPSYSLW